MKKAVAVIFHEYGHHVDDALLFRSEGKYQNRGAEHEANQYSNEKCRKSGLC